MIKFESDYFNFDPIILPEIGEVTVCVQGDESEDPHFHIYDHNKRIDYCIGIYDGLPRYYTTFNMYKHGELNNDQLKVIDQWKSELFRSDLKIIQTNWEFLAELFDRISDGNILENYTYGMEIPQYSK